MSQLLKDLKNENHLLKDNIWDTDLADMQLISKYVKGFRFLLCFIDIYSKYTWVVSLKNKKRCYNH